MRITANETTETTLAAMLRAADRHHPVTITYVKKDGTTTIRTVELFEIRTTKAGAVLLRGMDRQTGEARSFLLAGLVSYTIHRTAYVVPVPADETLAPVVAPTTPAALIALELGRDDRPATTRARLAHAA
jgi:predicted DNA-binding transcriptional regulator YafY